MNEQLPAEDFAQWIADVKPYLIEIDEEIRKVGLYGEMDIRVTIRGGKVEKLAFYGGRTWLMDKTNLTQLKPNAK